MVTGMNRSDDAMTRPNNQGFARPNNQGFALIAALYFTQGIPLGLAMETLPALLRQRQVPLEVLAWLPLVGLPWVAKVLWAPVVDDHWSPRLGRRRSWIIPMQAIILVALTVAALCPVDLGSGAIHTALFALASLAGATQDTATDGMAAERFSGPALARANGIQVAATMMGFFFGGSACLTLVGWLGRTTALGLVAATVAAGLLLALAWREPAHSARPKSEPASIAGFLARPGAWLLLALALLSAVTAASGFGLWKLLLLDRGWSLAQVGLLGMASGAVTVALGCGGGVLMLTRAGTWPTLGLGLACCLAGAALWALQAAGSGGGDPLSALHRAAVLPALAAGLGSFGAGASSVATMALAMRFAAGRDQAGTDMTAVQSTRDLGEIATAALLTGLAAKLGYGGAFFVVMAVAITAMIVVVTARRNAQLRQAAGELRP